MNKEKWKNARRVGDILLYWKWAEWLLYWILTSAGIISGCAFLLASLWMSLNANIHQFLLLFLTEGETGALSSIATAAYVALPECILFLALVTVISHVRTWFYSKDRAALTWAILYGIPTLVFLVLSVFTLGASVLNAAFSMPGYFVVTRAIAGYAFGVLAYLYHKIGKNQEADRLKEKDVLLAEERAKNAMLVSRIEIIETNTKQREQLLLAEIEQWKNALELDRKQIAMLQKEINNATESTLEAYGEECKNWLEGDAKTASIDIIMQFTGHSKRTITNAMRNGKLLVSSRNKELILMSSIAEWLKVTPPKSNEETGPILHIVNE